MGRLVKGAGRSGASHRRREHAGQWRITEGTHRIALGKAANDLVPTAEAQLMGACSEDDIASAMPARAIDIVQKRGHQLPMSALLSPA